MVHVTSQGLFFLLNGILIGTTVSQTVWFYGGLGASCDSACASLGGNCFSDAFSAFSYTRDAAGVVSVASAYPNNDEIQCDSTSSEAYADVPSAGNGFCFFNTMASSSTCGATEPLARRICPCRNVATNTLSPTLSPTWSPTGSPTGPPTLAPTLSGDPHLVGLRGQKFDLMGKPNTKYDLMHDDRLQVQILVDQPLFEHSADAKLRASGKHAGLFMTGVDIAYLDLDGVVHEVSIRGDFNSTVRRGPRYCDRFNAEQENCFRGLEVQAASTADVKLRNIDCPFNQRDGSCRVKATNGGSGLATLVTPSLTLEVGATFMNNHALGYKTVHHLDLSISDYRPSGKPGGLVGQTVEIRKDADGNPIMKGNGCIEGAEGDYIVAGFETAKLQNSPLSNIAFSASADGMAAGGVERV